MLEKWNELLNFNWRSLSVMCWAIPRLPLVPGAWYVYSISTQKWKLERTPKPQFGVKSELGRTPQSQFCVKSATNWKRELTPKSQFCDKSAQEWKLERTQKSQFGVRSAPSWKLERTSKSQFCDKSAPNWKMSPFATCFVPAFWAAVSCRVGRESERERERFKFRELSLLFEVESSLRTTSSIFFSI